MSDHPTVPVRTKREHRVLGALRKVGEVYDAAVDRVEDLIDKGLVEREPPPPKA